MTNNNNEGATVKVHEALSAVMGDVRVGSKSERMSGGGMSYAFRGIDAVVNAVAPSLRRHGVVVMPQVIDHEVRTVTTSGGKAANHVTVKVRYRFVGPDGDTLEAVSVGEATDHADKGTAKAMSVALRTCLLQALMLPTDEPDPDSEYHPVEAAPVDTTMGTMVFDPAEVGTWPEILSVAQAKQVAMYVAGGDKVDAADLWEADIARWESYRADDVKAWADRLFGVTS